MAGISGTGYSDWASGFSTNLAYATSGGSDTAVFVDSPGNDLFYACPDYNNSGKPLAGMYGSYGGGYSNRPAASAPTSAIQPTAAAIRPCFFDSPGNDTFYAYADYNSSGKPLAGMYGSYGNGYSNMASGFGTNVAYATDGGSDTALFFDSPGNDVFYAYADYNNSGKQLAGMYGSYGGGYLQLGQRFRHEPRLRDRGRQRYGRVLRLAGQRRVLCLRRLQQQRQATGGHVRQLRRRLFQLGRWVQHQRCLRGQRRQRHGRVFRLAGQRRVLCLRRLQ